MRSGILDGTWQQLTADFKLEGTVTAGGWSPHRPGSTSSRLCACRGQHVRLVAVCWQGGVAGVEDVVDNGWRVIKENVVMTG